MSVEAALDGHLLVPVGQCLQGETKHHVGLQLGQEELLLSGGTKPVAQARKSW